MPKLIRAGCLGVVAVLGLFSSEVEAGHRRRCCNVTYCYTNNVAPQCVPTCVPQYNTCQATTSCCVGYSQVCSPTTNFSYTNCSGVASTVCCSGGETSREYTVVESRETTSQVVYEKTPQQRIQDLESDVRVLKDKVSELSSKIK